MKIRGKTLIITVFIILSLTVSFFVISQLIIINSSTQSETNYMNLVLENTINSLNNELDSLNSTVTDWARWDEAYNFAGGTNPGFVNQSLDTFARSDVNLIVFTDSSGNIIYARSFDLEKNQELPLPASLNEDLRNNNLTIDTNGGQHLSGVVILNGTPMAVVSKAIVQGNGDGPPSGTLIMGHYLNQEEISRFLNNAVITIQPFDGSGIPSDFQDAKSHLSDGSPIYVTSLNSSSIAGYTILKGINDQPVLIMKVEMQRFIYQNYENAIFYLILSLIAAGLLAAMFITYYLDKNVLYRLDKITESIIGIGKSNDLSRRVPELGDDELYNLSTSVNKMLGSLEESKVNLERSEEMYRTIFENTGTVMVIVGEKMDIDLANTEFKNLTGLKRSEIENKKKLTDFTPEGGKVKDLINQLQQSKDMATQNHEIQLVNKNGEIRDFLTTFGFITGTSKVLISFIDITDHKKAEDKVRTSLKEKEVLLREIHHRVKNNLQIISTLLFLQSSKFKDPEIIENYRESENRIQSIALIHEKMYQSSDLSSIDFTAYLESLMGDLMHSYQKDTRNINTRIDTGNFRLNIETIQPLGMIINELVSNSFKYAFKDDSPGEIAISLKKADDQRFKLTVSDDGVGFPEDLDWKNTDSLGLQLVNTLVEQLEGTVEQVIDHGTRYEIFFKEQEYKKRI